MNRLHGVAIAFALACVPMAAVAQDAPSGDEAATASTAQAVWDGGEHVDAQGRSIEGDAGDEANYQARDERYADNDDYDARDRYDDRYANEADSNRRYDGDCRRKPDRASPVLGFLLGGLIGNQFGHGSGRALSTAVGAHLGHKLGRDVANNCEDRYYHRARRYGGLGFGIGYSHGGWNSGYSIFVGGSPHAYGFGYPGEYWRYRYHATPWRWHHH